VSGARVTNHERWQAPTQADAFAASPRAAPYSSAHQIRPDSPLAHLRTSASWLSAGLVKAAALGAAIARQASMFAGPRRLIAGRPCCVRS
jgi:hypothetical protein